MIHFYTGTFYQPGDKNSKVFNPGLLSIASYILHLGYSVKVVHCITEEEIDTKLKKVKALYVPCIIALSCSYMHTYLPSVKISWLIKDLFQDTLLVAGGQHIGDIASFALEETAFDIIIQGEGEYVFRKLLKVLDGSLPLDHVGNLYFRDELAKKYNVLDSKRLERFSVTYFVDNRSQGRYSNPHHLRSRLKEPLMPLNDMPFICYDLYGNYIEYPPYLEESRGCYGKCQ